MEANLLNRRHFQLISQERRPSALELKELESGSTNSGIPIASIVAFPAQTSGRVGDRGEG